MFSNSQKLDICHKEKLETLTLAYETKLEALMREKEQVLKAKDDLERNLHSLQTQNDEFKVIYPLLIKSLVFLLSLHLVLYWKVRSRH